MGDEKKWAQDFRQFANNHRSDFKIGSREIILEWVKSIASQVSLADVPGILEATSRFADRYSGILPIPPVLTSFVREFLHDVQADKALSVNAGYGSLLATAQVATGAGKVVAYDRSVESVEIGRLLNPSADWHATDFLLESQHLDQTFDAVVSILPLGWRASQPVAFQGLSSEVLEVRRDVGFQLLVAASMQLSDSGVGVFVTTSDFLWSRHSPIRQLPDLGLWVHAALELYSGAFEPSTSISTYVLVVRKQPATDMFVGRLTMSARANSEVIENLKARRTGKEVGEGRLVQPQEFAGIDALRVAEEVRDAERLFGSSAYILYDLRNPYIENPTSRGRSEKDFEFEERPNSIYIPTIGIRDVVCSPDEFQIKPQNYLQIAIDPAKSDARFIAEFLNTELGRTIREKSKRGSTIPQISIASLKTLRVLVPPLDLQRRVLSVGDAIRVERQRILGLENEMTEWERSLWSNPRTHARVERQVEQFSQRLSKGFEEQVEESLERWMGTLPFPLASITRIWYAAPHNDFDFRYRILVHFFEAATHFLGSALLSGFTSDPNIYEKYRADFLKSVRLDSLKRTDYGMWHQIGSYFSKRLRSLLHDGKDSRELAATLFSDRSNRFSEMLANKRLFVVLKEANELRNKWQGHTGLPGPREAEDRHRALLGQLNEVRNAMGDGWTNIELVVPSSCVKRRDRATNIVRLLQGSDPAFRTVERVTGDCLDADAMHLLGRESTSSLRLLPFVQLGPNPPSPSATCYFYSSEEDTGFRMISFQGSDQSEWTEPMEEIADALRLVTQGG